MCCFERYYIYKILDCNFILFLFILRYVFVLKCIICIKFGKVDKIMLKFYDDFIKFMIIIF